MSPLKSKPLYLLVLCPFSFALRPDLMTVWYNWGSELQAIMKIFNQNCCYHEIFHFEVDTFFEFITTKSLFPRLLKISRNFEISFFIVVSPPMTWITKKKQKSLNCYSKLALKSKKSYLELSLGRSLSSNAIWKFLKLLSWVVSF